LTWLSGLNFACWRFALAYWLIYAHYTIFLAENQGKSVLNLQDLIRSRHKTQDENMVGFVGFLMFFVENCEIFQKNSGASHHSTINDLPAITRYIAFLPEASKSIKQSRRHEVTE